MPGEGASSKILADARREREQAGKKVDLELLDGDPALFGLTNDPLNEALVQVAKEGWNLYPYNTPWFGRLASAIAKFENRYRGVSYPPDEILITAGVASAFQMIHYALLDPDDEVIALEPCHYLTGPVSYWYQLGAKPVQCRTFPEEGWKIDVDDLRKKINKKTKWITMVNPNNPTGAIYSESDVKKVVDIAAENDLPILSDEIYGMITFDGLVHRSLPLIAGDVPVIVVSGMSKVFMRTGWRIGYVCFHDPKGKISEARKAVGRYSRLYGHGRSCIPSHTLAAATKAYEGFPEGTEPAAAVRQLVPELQMRRDFLDRRYEEIGGIDCVKTRGALYTFPKIRAIPGTWKTEVEFLADLIKEEGIEIGPPGSNFGKSGFGHFRQLLLPKKEILVDSTNRLERFLKRHSAV